MARVDNVIRLSTIERVDTFKALVEGQTIFKYHVEICPVEGEYQINVISNRERTSFRELQSSLMNFLAWELIKAHYKF